MRTLAFAALVLASSAMGIEFQPVTDSARGSDLDREPWAIPAGYEQRIVADETSLDIYPGNDWNDMIAVNESGPQAGRYLYRTHEVRPGPGAFAGGAVSVVDLKTGHARVLAQRRDWEALDGIRWTPWGTLLVGEETLAAVLPDPQAPQAASGLVYELKLPPRDPAKLAEILVRPLLGSLAHEGIEVDNDGNVYVIDEERSGSIYKFVPERYGDLSKGQLFVLHVLNGAKTGKAEWLPLDMAQAQVSARIAAKAAGATPYCRPEDLERIGKALYIALTCEDASDPANSSGDGAVLSVQLGSSPQVSYFVAPGMNVARENRPEKISGFRNPDNLAADAGGRLWIVEDNEHSDIWVAEPDRDGDGRSDGVSLFASLKDAAAEGTGLYFGTAPDTLYVNVQHSGTGNDKTVAIRGAEHTQPHFTHRSSPGNKSFMMLR
jgi:hypothetical protein